METTWTAYVVKPMVLEGMVSKKFGIFPRNFCNGKSPNHVKTGPFKIRIFLAGFQMVSDQLAAICLDFIWLGFHILLKIRTVCNLTYF